ncbi:unnamed protein product, partial [Didymodactylos carnosus]
LLPVRFNTNFENRFVTIYYQFPPKLNVSQTVSFSIRFIDENFVSHIRAGIDQLTESQNVLSYLKFGLIPNFEHKIIFLCNSSTMGYAQSEQLFIPEWNGSYPFDVDDLRATEEYNQILLTWSNPHESNEPIQFSVRCDSRSDYQTVPPNNISFICYNRSFNTTDNITVRSQAVIDGYIYGQVGESYLSFSGFPSISNIEIENSTINSIFVKWNNIQLENQTRLYNYKIKCGIDHNIEPLGTNNSHHCTNLIPGQLYVITVYITNIAATIQRVKRINVNTFACSISSGAPYNVTFETVKSGYSTAVYLFTDTAPVITTTTTNTTISTATTTTATTITTTTTSTATTTTITTTSTTTSTATTTTATTTTTTTTSTATTTTITTTSTTTSTATTTTTTTTSTATTTTTPIPITTTTIATTTTTTSTATTTTTTTTSTTTSTATTTSTTTSTATTTTPIPITTTTTSTATTSKTITTAATTTTTSTTTLTPITTTTTTTPITTTTTTTT